MTTYYRPVRPEHQKGPWNWKTTVLTSFQPVSQWISIFVSFPRRLLSVFSSLFRAYLREVSRCKGIDSLSGLITAEQILLTSYLTVSPETLSVSLLENMERCADAPTASAIDAPRYAQNATHLSPDKKGLSVLDRRRLHIERGPGGDHDTLYCFSLPIELPQLQAWLRLQRAHVRSNNREIRPD